MSYGHSRSLTYELTLRTNIRARWVVIYNFNITSEYFKGICLKIPDLKKKKKSVFYVDINGVV